MEKDTDANFETWKRKRKSTGYSKAYAAEGGHLQLRSIWPLSLSLLHYVLVLPTPVGDWMLILCILNSIKEIERNRVGFGFPSWEFDKFKLKT